MEGEPLKKNLSLLKKLYRMPMDWLEEVTTSLLFYLYYFCFPSLTTLRRTSRCYSRKLSLHSTRLQDIFSFNSSATSCSLPWNKLIRIRTPNKFRRSGYPFCYFVCYRLSVISSICSLKLSSPRPTLLSLNRFEKKKNVMIALQAFSILINQREDLGHLRLVLGGLFHFNVLFDSCNINSCIQADMILASKEIFRPFPTLCLLPLPFV